MRSSATSWADPQEGGGEGWQWSGVADDRGEEGRILRPRRSSRPSRPRQSEPNSRTSTTDGGGEEEDDEFGGAVTTTMGFGIPGSVNAFGSGGGNH